jgi:hypothetical protein
MFVVTNTRKPSKGAQAATKVVLKDTETTTKQLFFPLIVGRKLHLTPTIAPLTNMAKIATSI